MSDQVLTRLGLSPVNSGACGRAWLASPTGQTLASCNPATGETIARVMMASAEDYDRVARDAVSAFSTWRAVPAPRRGEVVRKIGLALREHKEALGRLVTLETGKVLSEG